MYTATEGQIQGAIIDYLRSIGAVVTRVNAGVRLIQDSNGGTRAFRGAEKGHADILACVGGRYIAIEVKTRRGRVSPEQEVFLQRVRDAGGCAFVARSVDDVIKQLG